MISKALRDAYRVQFEAGGWSTPPGRAVCAIRAARAWLRLQDAIEAGIASVEWEDDEDYRLGDIHGMTEAEERAKFESGEWTGPFGCIVTYRGESSSCWGITLDQSGTRDPYARTMEADLASEVMPDALPRTPIPADYPVQPIDPESSADAATCGECGLSWDDGKATSMTPAPSGRCPFEYFHPEVCATV